MITRFVKIQLAVFLVIALGALTLTGVNYVGLDRVVSKPYKVKIYLAQTGNVYKNADVSFRGVTVGRVGSLELSATGVVANLHITSSRHIPADLKAVVADDIGELERELALIGNYLAERRVNS